MTLRAVVAVVAVVVVVVVVAVVDSEGCLFAQSPKRLQVVFCLFAVLFEISWSDGRFIEIEECTITSDHQ